MVLKWQISSQVSSMELRHTLVLTLYMVVHRWQSFLRAPHIMQQLKPTTCWLCTLFVCLKRGSLTHWGFFALVISDKYREILTQNPNDDPKSTQKWFCSRQSLGLKHVENLWSELKRSVHIRVLIKVEAILGKV